ncbi:hypothetical protein [Mesorhizobium sp. A623]
MFSHPAAILGFIVMAIGWLMLVGGGASGFQFEPRGIVNFHTLWIASGLIMTGGTLVVGGVVAGAGGRIRQALLFHPQIAAGEIGFQKAEKIRKEAESDYRRTGVKPSKAATDLEFDAEEALSRTLRERGLK